MNELQNMPYVTVEQVSTFRDAALQALDKKDAEIAELKELLNKALDERDHFLNDSLSAYIQGSDDCFKALKESGKLK